MVLIAVGFIVIDRLGLPAVDIYPVGKGNVLIIGLSGAGDRDDIFPHLYGYALAAFIFPAVGTCNRDHRIFAEGFRGYIH